MLHFWVHRSRRSPGSSRRNFATSPFPESASALKCSRESGGGETFFGTTALHPEGGLRMSKALYGYLGEPRAYVLLKQIADLQSRVHELEKALEAAEAELLALRAITSAKLEEAKALA